MFTRILLAFCAIVAVLNGAWAKSPARVHVTVVLVDNKHQGIVPVPAALGDGFDPARNLYWGAAYGVKTYLKRHADWKLVGCGKGQRAEIIETCTFRLKDEIILTADAWRGDMMAPAINAFMAELAEPVAAGEREMAIFVGHNGLMDAVNADLPASFPTGPANKRAASVYACFSNSYFSKAIEAAGAQTTVTTYGLMAPEAYAVEAAARQWAAGGGDNSARKAAAEAYARFQKISVKSAARLFGAKL